MHTGRSDQPEAGQKHWHCRGLPPPQRLHGESAGECAEAEGVPIQAHPLPTSPQQAQEGRCHGKTSAFVVNLPAAFCLYFVSLSSVSPYFVSLSSVSLHYHTLFLSAVCLSILCFCQQCLSILCQQCVSPYFVSVSGMSLHNRGGSNLCFLFAFGLGFAAFVKILGMCSVPTPRMVDDLFVHEDSTMFLRFQV